jgi:hypothetical protein
MLSKIGLGGLPLTLFREDLFLAIPGFPLSLGVLEQVRC